MTIPYNDFITPDPNRDNNNKENAVTMVTRPTPGKPAATGGGQNTRQMKELMAREDRRLARIQMEQRANEARAAANDITRLIAIREKQKEAKFSIHERQEAVRAPQLQIDQRGTLYLLMGLTIIMFIATAVLSADGTIGASAAAHYGISWFGYLLFGAVEVAILVFMLTYYVLGSRSDYDGKRVTAWHWFMAMVIASFVAVGLSVFHVLDVYKFDWTSVDMWVGVAIRLASTVFFVVCSKAAATVLFARAIRL